MPTVQQGVRTTATQSTETRRPRDVFPSLLKLEPDAAPLTVLMGHHRKRDADDPKIEWFELERIPQRDVLAAAIATAAATTITVTNYKYFRAGDLVLIVETGEIVIVATTPSTTTVTVTRAFGEVSAATAVNGGKLKIIGSAQEEDATSRAVLTVQRDPKFNYLGIIRDPFSISNTAKVTKTYAGVDFEEEAAEHLIAHKVKLELMNLQGQRYEDTSGTEPRRSSRGFFNWVTTNSLSVGGGLTEQVWDGALRRVFRFGSKTRLAICAPIACQAITGFAKEKLRVVDSMKKSYGLSITEYVSPFGRVMLANHNGMTNEDLNDFDDLAGTIGLVDLSYVEMRHMKGRITVRNENIQENDRDGRKDEYLSECGFQCGLEKTHMEITGING